MALEGEGASSILLSSLLHNVSAASFVDYSGVTNEATAAAASAMLKSIPAYALLGSSVGSKSFVDVLNLLK